MDGKDTILTNKICLSIGSNSGNRFENIKKAVKDLYVHNIRGIKMSSIYESAPFGFVSDTDFYNIVLIAQTELSPLGLLAACQSIESKMGRIRTKSNEYESRAIDLDIIYYNDLVIKGNKLAIPHPRAHLRPFVIVPLFEILKEHSISNKFIEKIKKQKQLDRLLASQKPITKIGRCPE